MKTELKDLYHYVILRDDLTPGQAIAQTIHAAGESNPAGLHSYAVALSVPKEKLKEIEQRLCETDINHVAVYEPDSPFDGEITAIGISPIFKSKNKDLRRIVSGLKLYR